MQNYTAPRFSMGRPVITPAAEAALNAAGIHPIRLLARHIHGDWGDLDSDDRQQNDLAVQSGARVLSNYRLPGGERIWIITEADRASTTILLPGEY